MERIKHKWIVEQAIKVVKSVLEEGVQVGKDVGDVPEWQTKTARFHAMRAHAHLEHWLWDKKSEGHLFGNEVEDEINLHHALVRSLLSILKLEEEYSHSD